MDSENETPDTDPSPRSLPEQLDAERLRANFSRMIEMTKSMLAQQREDQNKIRELESQLSMKEVTIKQQVGTIQQLERKVGEQAQTIKQFQQEPRRPSESEPVLAFIPKEIEVEQTSPSVANEVDAEKISPSMTNDEDFEPISPSVPNEADFERISPSVPKGADVGRSGILESLLQHFNSEHSEKKNVLQKRLAPLLDEGVLAQRRKIIDLVKVQLGRLYKAKSKEVFDNILKQMSKPELAEPHFERVFFQQLLGALAEDKGSNTDADSRMNIKENSCHIPKASEKQMKLFCLLQQMNTVPALTGILARFVNFLCYALLHINRLDNMKRFEAENLVRFYLLLLRSTGEEERIRTFLFDLMFFKSPRNHIFIVALIEVWPELLTWYGFPMTRVQNVPPPNLSQPPPKPLSLIHDPIFEVIVWMVYNTGPKSSYCELRVFDARNLLGSVCNVNKPHFTAADLVIKFITQVKENRRDAILRKTTSLALLLIAKVQEYRWTNNHIISRLLEHLGEFNKIDAIVSWVLETIGLVSRVYPVGARNDLLPLFEEIEKILNNAQVSECVERAAIIALMRVGHHLQYQLAGFLNTWSPRHPPLPPKIITLLSNYCGTRGKKFSEDTVMFSKKHQLLKRKKKLKKDKVKRKRST